MNAITPPASLASGTPHVRDAVRVSLPVATFFGHVVRPAGGLGRLVSFDAEAARRCAGVVDVVRRGDFLAVVAASVEQAEAGAQALRAVWEGPDPSPAVTRVHRIAGYGDADAIFAGASAGDGAGAQARASASGPAGASTSISTSISTSASAQGGDAVYRWPLIAPRSDACGTAIAHWRDGTMVVWLAGAQPGALRLEVAALLSLPETQVAIVCDPDPPAGHDDFCARQAAADAALLAHAVRRPVRVTFRADPAAFAPRLTLAVRSTLGPASAYRINASATAGADTPIALLQTGTTVPYADAGASGHDPVADGGTLVPPYAPEHLTVTATLPPDASANPIATAPTAPTAPTEVAARAHVFAHESQLDELAVRAAVDPIALRLQWLDDTTGSQLIERVAAQAGWNGPLGSRMQASDAIRRGRGFAYARAIDIENGRPTQTWSAWVADVEVDARTGDISVTRVTVGHEREDHASPARPTPLRDDIAAATRQLTTGGTGYDDWGSNASQAIATQTHALADPTHASTQPSHTVARHPQVNVVGALAGGASATLPAAAAVANAIHDATGIRLREPPFSAGEIRQGLASREPSPPRTRKRGWLLAALAPVTAFAGLCATILPWRAPLAPVAPPVPGFYSAATIERGRLVAAAGDCAVCHTAPGGTRNAGGLALETPFGTVYSTNITPDEKTGIGNWSYAAFERAMREGIHRDGRRLYPAFPYTAFAKVTDADMQALYAYLMSAEPVSARPPETKLDFPFNLRPALAGWNALFHRNAPFEPVATRSAQWNRGAYLAEGLGHCSACHSPRNALGAEQGGRAYLTGGMADGWEAPALTALSKSPVPWTEEDLFQYLRTGYAARHGAAAGPMAPVVESLRELPESDVRAIAHYVASFSAPAAASAATSAVTSTITRPDAQVRAIEARSEAMGQRLNGNAGRLYQAACAVCHQSQGGVPQFGVKPSLAVNTNLHSARPDNVIQAVLHGISAPPHAGIGYMPGFADSLDDEQVSGLVHYLRERFAPDAPKWSGVEEAVAKIRRQATH
ncbi:c-type cytochrome [Cupriavidus plantarum]|uniref:c-type cytochrome n=1 Tax=Cupriavidus plantarum TaxID=942865 RepID=UPI000E27615F|nr:c-type cytochrome [Cupriavidus plantarum]REE90969.1 nicotinate dehydrogenase subunit B [Cupriavidus plantarum]